MSEGDEMLESATVVVANTVSVTEGSNNSQCRNNMKRASKEDTFVSASDLSSFLESSRISSSNSESNSNSTSSSFNNSNSSSAYADNSSSSSTHSGLNGNGKNSVSTRPVSNQESSSDNTDDGGKPLFATCSSVATSISSATTVRRSESWSVLRSTSVDSSKNGSEADNNDDRTSVTSLNDQSFSESHAPEFPDTYHTPSASLHNITTNKQYNIELKHESVPERQELENHDSLDGEMEIDQPETSQPENHLVAENKDNSNDENLSKSLEIITSCEGEDKKEDKDDDDTEHDNKTENIPKTDGELIQSVESNTSKDSFGSVSKEVQVIKQVKSQQGLREKPTKKKMWYQQIFSASYKSRSGDFKKLFKELPIKERLLVDYSCALQKEILVQGRMYVSQGFLSFHANIFGWETQTSIRLKEITSITKEKTALVIPNAIQVMTDTGDKYFFTSFVTRDATYLMLFKLWQSALLEDVSTHPCRPQVLGADFSTPNRQTKSMPSREVQRLIHACYGEELVITSEEETEDILSCKSSLIADTIDASTLAVYNLVDPKSIVIDQRICASDIGLIGPAITVSGNLGSSIVTSNVLTGELQQNGIGAISLEHTDLSDTSDSDEEFQNPEGILLDEEEEEIFEIPICCATSHSEGRETIHAVIPCNIDQLFTMLFTNSKFYLDLHTARKTFDINQSPWEIGKDGKKTRQVSMTVSLSAVMGPKHSQVTETQVMLPGSKPGHFYAIDSESVNAGIPYADTFYVTIHYCLSRVSANESKLIVVNQVKYKKSAWGITKSIIEKNCWAGIEEFYSHLERALKEECAKMILGASPVPSPKLTAANIPRRRPLRNKRKAPDVPVCSSPIIPRNSLRNGTIPGVIIGSQSTTNDNLQTTSDGSVVVKIILSVLACLLLLNAFLYFKLTRLETSATSTTFPPQSFTFTGEIPENHQDWLILLQKQEVLHRIELQKWHEILMSALKILHQAESDLEALKYHISSYSGGKYSVEILKQSSDITETTTTSAVVSEQKPLPQTIKQSEKQEVVKNLSEIIKNYENGHSPTSTSKVT